MIKLIYPLRRLPSLTREAFQTYWRETHAPLVHRHADVLGIRAYVQCHTVAASRNDTVRRMRGGSEDYDGVAELWFDTVAALTEEATEPAAAAAAAELLADEKRFIDVDASPIFCASEHVVIAHPLWGNRT
ncbi:MAG: EthD domain-containing protein [Alphaproteobacteria bacterium]